MILKFSKDLKKQEIFANGNELAAILAKDRDEKGNRKYTWPDDVTQHVVTIDNPVLVTDNYRICQFEPTLRDTIFALYSSPVKITEYNGTRIEFNQNKNPGVWGPSIDTLFLCLSLEKIKKENIKSAIEVGSGSGFVSKYIVDQFYNLETIELIDFNPKAIESSKEAINNSKAKYIVGDALKYIKETNNKYDLVICNPPYIPRPKSVDDNPYEGVELLTKLIGLSDKLLSTNGSLVINLSNLCSKQPLMDIQKKGFVVLELEKMTVPLKVFNVLNNKEWLEFLLERGLHKEYKNGYEYWHSITTYEIKRKE
ncbi:MAG TPA: methyltransferase [Candidatus Diapherotrites archaeon]|jgi:release factor glutamine methyltransferase|nr:methyltransferase [Candidatus Diapherotrites archaeon]